MDADVIVVGLGAMGSAAAWQLARRGARVLGLDRFAPPHDRGSSHGLTRVTREAVGEGEAYAPLVRRSHVIWAGLEAELAGSLQGPLMTRTGVLVIGPAGSDTAFVARTRAVAQAFGVPHEALDAAELRRRWPQFSVDDGEVGCFEPGGGVVYPERCIGAQLAMAQRAGATLHSHEPVQAIEPDGAAWRVRTARGTHRAAQVLVTAGAWLPGLLKGFMNDTGPAWTQQLRVLRQVLHWLAPAAGRAGEFAPERCPTFIVTRGERYEDTFYGMPLLDATGGVKVGTEQFERDTTPDSVEREVGPDETHALVERLVKPRLPGLSGRALRGSACLYTMAADGRFRIGDAAPGLTLVSACSGHGFKHSAALGEALAERVLQGHSALDLSAFAP